MDGKIDQLVAYQMGVVTHFIHNYQSHHLSNYGLTRAQAKVLYLLNHYGDSLQAELQKRLYIQASTVNGIIDSLLKSELVRKEDSKVDRRTKVISLTAEGKRLESLLWGEMDEIEKNLMEGFSDEERRLMVSWLKKMKMNIERKHELETESYKEKKEGALK